MVNQICLQALYDVAAKNSEVVGDAHIQRVLADQESGGDRITGRSCTPEVTDGTTTTKMAECRYNSHANGGEKFTAIGVSGYSLLGFTSGRNFSQLPIIEKL